MKSCSTHDSFVALASKRGNPGPVAGACDGHVNLDPDSDEGGSSEYGHCGSHLESGRSESLESSSSVLKRQQ